MTVHFWMGTRKLLRRSCRTDEMFRDWRHQLANGAGACDEMYVGISYIRLIIVLIYLLYDLYSD